MKKTERKKTKRKENKTQKEIEETIGQILKRKPMEEQKYVSGENRSTQRI